MSSQFDTDESGEQTENEHSKQARIAAEAICQGMILHDRREYRGAIDSFTETDVIWFDVDDETARNAATAYVDALRLKDEIERHNDLIGLGEWDQVEGAFRRRAEALGINRAYAPLTTDAWMAHKLEENYWTPFLLAQQLVVQAATGIEDYPRKESDARHGLGPEPARYLLSVELHDLHDEQRWEEAAANMTTYFETILRLREDEDG
jgi:hypothetical protein